MDIFKTVTLRHSFVTVSGTILNGLLGALFFIILARFLGPVEFGLLTIAIVSLTLVADIVDFGTNTGLVRFVSSNLVANNDEALKFLKLALEVKLLVWLVVLLIGFFLTPFVADKLFQKRELELPLRLVLIGVGGALLFSFATSTLQAYQKYFTWAVVNIIPNLLRLGVVTLLLFARQLNLLSSLNVYIALPFLGFFLSLLFIPTRAIFTTRGEFTISKKFFHYNFWVAFFTIIAAISSRLDTFLNARLLSTAEVGIYGAANQLVSVGPQIVSALGLVAAPKLAGFQTSKQMITYFKKFQLLVLGLAVLGLLAIPASYFLIPLIYGTQYHNTILPFIILLLAMLVFLISVPVHNSIIYYFGKPQVFVWVSIGHLLIIGFLGFWLISNYGVVGAAISVLVGMIFNFLAPLGWFLYKLIIRKKEKN